MLLTPTSAVLGHHSLFALLTDWRSLLVCIAVTKNCLYAHISFFSSAFHGGGVDVLHVFKGVTALAESVVLLSSPSAVRPFVSDVGLFSII